jgi:hypothetical protein
MYSLISKRLYLFLLVIALTPAFSHTWVSKPFSQKVFIENLGQFRIPEIKDSILYAFENCGMGIYFTRFGVYWKDTKALPSLIAKGEEAEDEGKKIKISTALVFQRFLNADPELEVLALEKTSDYYTYYSVQDSRARAYRRLTYRNIYSNTDLEFSFHPSEGVKYSFILHPGAEPGNIAFEYTGQDHIMLSAGNIVIKTVNGGLKDHAPVSFYEDSRKIIPTSFRLTGNRISFAIGSYNKKQKVVIDPWIVPTTSLTVDMKAFEVDFDKYDNVFVAGGHGNYKIQKYSPAGTLLWTYSAPFGELTSTASTFGDMAVSREGFSYLTEGFGARGRVKVDPNGNQIWYNNTGNFFEFFHLAFNRTFTRLVMGGRQANGGDFAFIDTTNGSIISFQNVSGSEVRSLCIAPSGNVYGLTCITVTGLGGNFLVVTNSALAPTSFVSVPSGYAWGEQGVAYGNGNTIFGPGWQGQNGIAVNNCYIYTASGSMVDRRDLSTGAVIATTPVPGGIQEQNSGITIDSCGFIYVGSQGAVYKYDETLTAPIVVAPVPGAVYDIAVANDGTVLAAGNGFVASFDTMHACNFLPYNCPSIAVPLNLISLSGKSERGKNIISWTGASASPGSVYYLQRSSDGNSFEDAERIICLENSDSYTAIDNHPFLLTYYRLKQVDANSRPVYSSTISIRSSPEEENVHVTPNPVKSGGILRIGLTGGPGKTCEISLFTLQSKKILSFSRKPEDSTREFSLDLPSLPSGTYILEVISGNKVFKRRIVMEE